MFSIPFHKMSPGGNTTILVPHSAVDAPRRAEVATRLMHTLHLGAEQVGFIDMAAPTPRLDMMGGEFCGNACRCLAALLLLEGRVAVDGHGAGTGHIASSGVSTPVHFTARHLPDGTVDASIRMDLPALPAIVDITPGMSLVPLPGISHLLLDLAVHPYPEHPGETVPGILQRYGLDEMPAAGCIWFGADGGRRFIRPVVYVRDTATIHEETACGSGTLALALFLSQHGSRPAKAGGHTHGQTGTPACDAETTNHGQHDAGENSETWHEVGQPSGAVIRATVKQQAAGVEAWIGGPVSLIATGTAYVPAS